MPLPDDFDGSEWTSKTARTIMPWLIWSAKNHRTLCYSDLDAEIVRRGIHHHVNFVMYGHPAGRVGNALLEIASVFGSEIPPLNSLVVKKTGKEAGLPGDGCDWYLQKFLKKKVNSSKLTIEDKRAITLEVHAAVFAFDRWDDVQNYFADVVRRYPELMGTSNNSAAD